MTSRNTVPNTAIISSCQQLGRAFISAMFGLSEERIQSKSMDRARERALTCAVQNAQHAIEIFLSLAAETDS